MANSIPDEPGFETHLPANPPDRVLKLMELDVDQVEKIMKQQKPKMSSGIDDINNKLVKNAAKKFSNTNDKNHQHIISQE